MKRFLFASSLLGLVAGVGLLASSASFAATPKPAGAAAPFPDGTYDIALDGFCTVFHVTKPGAGGYPSIQATDIGCGIHTLIGSSANNGLALVYTDTGVTNNYVFIHPNGTFVFYVDCGGGTECISVSGTWNYNGPTRPGLPDAATVRPTLFGGGAERHPVANFTMNIAFDGYCDGERLHIPGSAGAPGVDGNQTGCVSNPLIGARFNGPSSASMWDYTDLLLYVVNRNHTWVIFNDVGGGVSGFVNSGTWSPGSPAAPQGNRTSLPSSLRH